MKLLYILSGTMDKDKASEVPGGAHMPCII